ncbi:MAG: hypothetical protein ACR2KJ_11240 [Jatrophihabitans sp.]
MTIERPIFLLGAGASKAADLPLASELTGLMIDHLGDGRSVFPSGKRAAALRYVVSAMIHHAGIRGEDPQTLPDIETVVSAIELLGSRDRVEISPFVQWADAVNSMDETSGAGATDWVAGILKDYQERRSLWTVQRHSRDKAFRDVVRNAMGVSTGKVYEQLLDSMVKSLVPLLAVQDEARLDYLRPLVELGRNNAVTIATLNYDLTIETAARLADVRCSTGVESWENQGRVVLPDHGVRLLKLHGSVDWARDHDDPRYGSYSPDGPLPSVRLPRTVLTTGCDTDPSVAHDWTPFVIFGRREKLRAPGPFLALRSELESRLAGTTCLIVIGYSFSDDHINEMLARWLNIDPVRVLLVVDPSFSQAAGDPTDQRSVVEKSLCRQWPQDQSRLLVIPQRAEEVLGEIVNWSASDVRARINQMISARADLPRERRGEVPFPYLRI